MSKVSKEILEKKLDKDDLAKLMKIDNPELHEFVAKYLAAEGSERQNVMNPPLPSRSRTCQT